MKNKTKRTKENKVSHVQIRSKSHGGEGKSGGGEFGIKFRNTKVCGVPKCLFTSEVNREICSWSWLTNMLKSSYENMQMIIQPDSDGNKQSLI